MAYNLNAILSTLNADLSSNLLIYPSRFRVGAGPFVISNKLWAKYRELFRWDYLNE